MSRSWRGWKSNPSQGPLCPKKRVSYRRRGMSAECRKPYHSGFRFIRLTTTASTNTTRPKMTPRTTAVIVPEARPISQPPAPAGVPHCGFLLFPMRMAQNTVSGIATATKRAARQPIPKPVEAGFGFGSSDWCAMTRPVCALRKTRQYAEAAVNHPTELKHSHRRGALAKPCKKRHDDEIADV